MADPGPGEKNASMRSAARFRGGGPIGVYNFPGDGGPHLPVARPDRVAAAPKAEAAGQSQPCRAARNPASKRLRAPSRSMIAAIMRRTVRWDRPR